MKLFMHFIFARSETIGHEVRYAITLIKLTFLFTFQVRAMYNVHKYVYRFIVNPLHIRPIAYMRNKSNDH